MQSADHGQSDRTTMGNGNGNRPAWAAMSGAWSFQDSRAEYAGAGGSPQPVGVALSSARIRNGRMSAHIRLGNPDENAGRLLLGYNTATGGYYSAGLGGYGRAYLIDEHVPGLGWQAVKHEGRVSQLQASTAYEVEVDVKGQRLCLAVDGIELIDQHLPHPLEGDQAGLFAWGPGPITFEDVEWSGVRPRAFVVMQFTEPFDSLYAEVIRPVCEERSGGIFPAFSGERAGSVALTQPGVSGFS